MREIKTNNLIIEIECYDRFRDLIRGYRVDEQGNIKAFLGKYIVCGLTQEEIINLYQ